MFMDIAFPNGVPESIINGILHERNAVFGIAVYRYLNEDVHCQRSQGEIHQNMKAPTPGKNGETGENEIDNNKCYQKSIL